MKNLMLFCAIAVMGYALQGQDKERIELQDHLLYDDATLYQIRDEDHIILRNRIILNDGTVVNRDGSYQTRTGEPLRLMNGQCMDMDGNLYRSRQQFRRQAARQLRATTREHFMLQDGRLYRVHNSERERVLQGIRLHNDIVVETDGSYQDKNGKKLQLRDGECLDTNGKRYQSQGRFREITAARLRGKE